MAKKPRFEIATDTRLLYAALVAVKPGEEITYAALSKDMGRPIGGGDPYLQSALRRAFAMDGAVFDNVRGVGYRRLQDPEIVASSIGDTDTLRRRAKRAARKLGAVTNYTDLPADTKVEYNARLSVFGAIAAMTSQKAIEGVKESVGASGRELPFAKTLEAFRRA